MMSLTVFSSLFSHTPSTSYSKKKKITLILLALFVWWALFSGAIDDSLVKSSLWFHNKINSSRIDATTTTLVIPDQKSLTNSWTDTLTNTGYDTRDTTMSQTSGTIVLESDNEDISIITNQENNLKKDNTTNPVEKKTNTISTVYAEWTYAKVIPYLVSTYKLTDSDKTNPVFEYVSASSSLYKSFATAYSKWMIGPAIKPTTRVSCQTYLVLKWIAAWWKVSYKDSPFEAYRTEANRRWLVNWCKVWWYVTSKTL